MFCMEFILHEILKYKLNNLHLLIFLHVLYLLGLLGYHNNMRVQCSAGDSVNLGGGGGGSSRNFPSFKEGLRNFQDPG